MVNIPLLTRVSYKYGGFLAGISGCHQQDGSWFYIFLGRITYPGIRVGTFSSRWFSGFPFSVGYVMLVPRKVSPLEKERYHLSREVYTFQGTNHFFTLIDEWYFENVPLFFWSREVYIILTIRMQGADTSSIIWYSVGIGRQRNWPLKPNVW